MKTRSLSPVSPRFAAVFDDVDGTAASDRGSIASAFHRLGGTPARAGNRFAALAAGIAQGAAPALAGLLLAALALPALAADPAEPPLKLEPVPDGAPTLEGGKPPDITVRRDGSAEFKEYRVNGRLYAVKVTPNLGKPYWLIDRSGGGQLQRFDGPSPNLTVPSWLILEW